MVSAPAIDAVVVAAGRGLRLGTIRPKQYLALGQRTVLARTLDAFLDHRAIRRVMVAIGPGDDAAFADAVGARSNRVETVVGGATRQASVRAALEALRSDPPASVLVHDGARPFISADVIDRVVAGLQEADAVIPAIPVADTLKRVADGRVAGTVPREGLAQAQTPQGFAYRRLMTLHERSDGAMTDDAALMEASGEVVRVVEGERSNYKITTRDDLDHALRGEGFPVVGQGFDVHRLEPGGPLHLGGLILDVDRHLAGHSDADVALHALTDALFGAIGAGDIGSHFPPSDMRWKGASSDLFLQAAAREVREVGAIINVDLTIICEWPKIGPIREAMRERIAAIIDLPAARVSVKATTTERLGFTGRGEGIAAQAVAMVLRR